VQTYKTNREGTSLGKVIDFTTVASIGLPKAPEQNIINNQIIRNIKCIKKGAYFFI